MDAHESPVAQNTSQQSGFAISGFVLSLVGLFFLSLIVGGLAIIFSAIALNRANQNPAVYGGKGFAIAGLVIGIVDVVWGALTLALWSAWAPIMY